MNDEKYLAPLTMTLPSEIGQIGSPDRVTERGLVVTRPSRCFVDHDHGFERFWGVSKMLTGAEKLSMAVGTLKPGTQAVAHSHAFETGIYITAGAARVFSGHKLEHQEDVEAGDFIFIPPNVPHYPVTLGEHPMSYLVVRNSPDAD